MKFKEFLKEDPTATLVQWLEKHMEYSIDDDGYRAQYSVKFGADKTKDQDGYLQIVDDGKKIIFDGAILQVNLNFKNEPFRQPPGEPEWQIDIDDGIMLRIKGARINDWNLMPPADISGVILRECIIDTWKGIDKALPVVHRLELRNCEQIKKNIIYIYKMPYLDRIHMHSDNYKDELSKLAGKMQDAMNHNKSLIDFQNELIDADLDDWAQP